MLHFFLAHGTVGHQRGAAFEVVFNVGHISLCAGQVGLALADLGLQGGVVGKQGAHFAQGLAQLGFCLGLGQLSVGSIQADEG